jgi:hypothetical protein
MNAKSEGLAEYLYVDEERLNSYFEQISPPVAYDKVPVWRAALKLTGPEADATQARLGRQFTRQEKILALLDYLRTGGLLRNQRLGDRERWALNARDWEAPFVIESIRATRVLIPPHQGTSKFPGLTMWISVANPQSREDEQGSLYLLESFPKADSSPYTYTSYSALAMLLQDVEELRESVLGRPLDLEEPTERLDKQFSSDPVTLLTGLGARAGATRSITSLYRIRATLNDRYSKPQFSITTIGYPIFVAEAGSF